MAGPRMLIRQITYCHEHDLPSIKEATHCSYAYWLESRLPDDRNIQLAQQAADSCRMINAELTAILEP